MAYPLARATCKPTRRRADDQVHAAEQGRLIALPDRPPCPPMAVLSPTADLNLSLNMGVCARSCTAA
jgi:hypothetical protein